MTQFITGIAWYDEKQWEKMRACSVDKDQLHETYSDWLVEAEKTFKGMAREGITVKKVYVDVDQLQAWAGKQMLPINGRSRAGYAQYLVSSQAALTGPT